GLVVLAFPTLDFRKEFKKSKEAKNFCQSKYGVDFTILDTIYVNGKNQDPLFKYLKSKKKNKVGVKKIVYNFTKFLVDRNGNVVARFGASKTPEQIEDKIISLLEEKC
nr:glutathione peroxidase [Mycoplasmatales bacterium]